MGGIGNCIMKSSIICTTHKHRNKSRSMKWAAHVACIQKMRNAHNILAGKDEGQKTLGSTVSYYRFKQ
jgi:hypothetical protein